MKSIEAINYLVESYKVRDMDSIDDFMNYISDDKMAQMIGIGATVPDAYEWFTGKEAIKEIILSDWANWGNVHFDMSTLRLTERTDSAWFTLCATLEQVEMSEETWEFFLSMMKEMLDKKEQKAADRMFEAAHFGMRRVREKNLGEGYPFQMVVTGHMILEDNMWKFHTLHWSMPVE